MKQLNYIKSVILTFKNKHPQTTAMKIKLTLLGILVSMGVVSAQTATTKPVGYHTETAKVMHSH